MSGHVSKSKLQALREFTGLSHEKVARELGISAKTLERWERGTTPIKRYQAAQLAELYVQFGVDASQVIEEVAA